MNGRYLGHVSRMDPLYGYLRHDILPQLGVSRHDPEFRVFQSVCSRDVYLYAEKRSGARVVGKFYPERRGPDRVMKGETEYNNLVFLRSLGLDSPPHYVVRPLGYNADIGGLLVMEHLGGQVLGAVINQAIHQGERDRLYRKLASLAHFLATMHNRTAKDWGVVFTDAWAYTGRLIGSLVAKRGMGRDHSDELYALRDAWRERGCMWEDRAVLAHGDVTPSNFLFGGGDHVMAIDLERMQWADRVFDLGRLCGELKHFFCQGTGGFGGAEPFIGHFLWEYCRHFPDRMSAFSAITRRAPFYIGITLLRIARNSWIDQHYRWRLVHEAKQTLRALP
ncbi:phosphotransferase family protein [Fundidesulfovibrio terrae]|uniref:phosphotransferase family protein n=1 Tax=Fundidesulfovibrio terrae TaxID=2922866 RepID=UPI001FAF99B1|nr:aminoglycoside phosphotransferase family protein [Fundidesulfovibrio terrae]